MANSETEQHMLAKAGLKTVWVNQNIFVSPTIFRILPESEKRFDAIYDARISSFKRHKLAAEIASLALITARVPYHHNESYIHSIKLILPQAYWFNDPLATDYQWMSLSEINAAINQCRVGLCLSAEEGAMFASMQYLLAGLPIVSTASRGGRNEFFSPDYVRIVADSVEAIAAGVREMSNCPVPPGEIRRRTLEKVERHKTRLFELLDSICSDKHWRVNMRSSWNSWMHSPNSIATPAAIRNRIERAATITTASPL
jgi:glycosyltransferase involved in cell wall biosynthesis